METIGLEMGIDSHEKTTNKLIIRLLKINPLHTTLIPQNINILTLTNQKCPTFMKQSIFLFLCYVLCCSFLVTTVPTMKFGIQRKKK